MNFRKYLSALILFVMLVVPSVAFAEGFGIYEWSANGVALSENNMFGENDPSVLAYNPAAITRFDGSYFSIGASFVNPQTQTTFKGLGALNAGNSTEWNNNYSPAIVPYTYYATKAGKNSWYGLAIYSRFGNQIEYDKLWPGRFDTIFSGIQGITVQPTYAFKITPKFSAAVGLDINFMNMVLKKNPDKPINFESETDGSSVAYGGLLSLMYDFTPKTSAALVYRTEIKHTMNADVKYTPALAPSTIARGSVTLPDSISFGVGHKFNKDKTRVEFDAVWTNWSTYDKLRMVLDSGQITDSSKNWNAVWRFGVGLEHKLNNKWSFLCGYVWDQSPVPDATMDFTVPTGDRHRGSVGFKYRPNDRSEWTLAYSAIWAGERQVLSHIGGKDFAQPADLHDGLTQVVAIGYTMKLK